MWEDHAGFEPVLWPHRLEKDNSPAKRKKPARIFVVSMGDLFGEWVPDGWIEKVFEACEAAPQHTYFFLTKNPGRYGEWQSCEGISSFANYWFGISATDQKSYEQRLNEAFMNMNYWFPVYISLEPLQSQITKIDYPKKPRWLIVGSETRNGRSVNLPKREWILDIRKQCKDLGIPLFEKNSLTPLDLPGGLIQEWPKGV
jgi:protein gp37